MNLGTIIYTWLKGNFVGEDNMGNKYYTNSKNSSSINAKRWVIYNGEIEASKIPNEWYSWMHFINNNIENTHQIKKYEWQKEHLSNQTGSENSYHPKKNKNAVKKKYNSWKS